MRRAILTYHSIDPSGSVISVHPEVFREHVAWLASGAVRVLPVPDLLLAPPAAAAVALTFDDAYANFASEAWPLLRSAGLPVTLFVPTAHVGRANGWAAAPGTMPTLPLLPWDELRRIGAEGVTLGAHSRTHPDLRRLPPDRLLDETRGAADDLEAQIGTRPLGFAYPYGLLDEQASAAVRAQYAWACATDLRLLGPADDRWRLPRVDMYYLRRPGAIAAWHRWWFPTALALRRIARRARRLLTDAP